MSTNNETLVALADSIYAKLKECEIIARRLGGDMDFPKPEERETEGVLGSLQFTLFLTDYWIGGLKIQLQHIQDIVLVECGQDIISRRPETDR